MILSDAGADAMLAGNFSTSCNTGYIRIYSGTAPATANAAITGTLLVGDARFECGCIRSPRCYDRRPDHYGCCHHQ